jgi:Rieske Fe-S protein
MAAKQERAFMTTPLKGLLLALLLLVGCRDQNRDFVPNIQVDVFINLNLPSYQAINVVGGLLEFPSAGYRGLIIYRQTIDDFLVFDQACTYMPSEPCHVVSLDSTVNLLACACCESRFSLDGFPARGPATFNLKPYRSLFSPNSNTLRITN